MAESRYFDFDSFASEANAKPIVFKYKDVEYTLPHELPFSSILSFNRFANQDDDVELSTDAVENFYKLVLTESVYASLIQNNVGATELQRIVGWAMKVYGLENKSDSPKKMKRRTQ